MSALREAVLLQMRLRGFAAKTVEAYIHAMEQLWAFYRRSLERLSCEDVQRFLDEIITVRKLAWSTINVYFSAYRFLYTQVLKRTAVEFSIPPRGRSGRRPSILSREDVMKLIESPLNVKHRALLSMVYGSGLRVSEVVKTQPIDVDRGRMMLKVNGKGHKDRYTILATHTLLLLEEHWRTNRPEPFFFSGRDRSAPMPIYTAQAVYYAALARSGVHKVGGIHTLRHCFASHALEDGHDIFCIKRWLGHSMLITTGGYIHTVPGTFRNIPSPLDKFHREA
jgi:site-specific recombinase XerD